MFSLSKKSKLILLKLRTLKDLSNFKLSILIRSFSSFIKKEFILTKFFVSLTPLK